MRNDFCAFILSHGRPNNIKTLKTLKNAGYTGKVYIVIDDEDNTADEYRRIHGDKIIQFSKANYESTTDTADARKDHDGVVYARNACFDLAKNIGCRYFIVLDDDYTSLEYRFIQGGSLRGRAVMEADKILCSMVDFLDASGALTVAFAQGGDLIGGAKGSKFKKGILRKAMNSFICDIKKPFRFVGRINEDTNTYVVLGSRGELMFTICSVSLTQTRTQKSSGGMSGLYEDGTYLKSMYSVMMHPSSVTVKEMGDKHLRLHHSIDWNATVPKIIREA